MKKIATSLAIALVLGSVSLAESDMPPSPTYVPTIKQTLRIEALKADVDPRELIAIATCESSLSPVATNGVSFGVLQFIPSTWARYTKLLKIESPDIWDVQQQAYVASYLFSTGEERQWSCYRIIHGKMEGNH